MDFSKASEEDLDLAYEALMNPERESAFQADAGLVVLADELAEWLEDDRQWVSAVGANWVSLIDDLLVTHDACGEAVRAYLDTDTIAWVELRACRSLLKEKSRRAPDPALRRRLARAAETISTRLRDAECLVAAWKDLLAADDHRQAAAEARSLLSMARLRGRDPSGLAGYLRRIVADEKVAISYARGEPKPEFDRSGRADSSPGERAQLVAAELQNPPKKGEMVVWLRYALAEIGPEVLEVGDSLTFFRQDSIAEQLTADSKGALPPSYGRRGISTALGRLPKRNPTGIHREMLMPFPMFSFGSRSARSR